MQCPSRTIVNPSDELGRIVNLVDESPELVLEVDDQRKGHTAPQTAPARSRGPQQFTGHEHPGDGHSS